TVFGSGRPGCGIACAAAPATAPVGRTLSSFFSMESALASRSSSFFLVSRSSAWHAATAKRAAHTRVRFIISRMLEPSLVRSRSVCPICDEQKDAPKLVGANLVPHSAEVASDLGAAFGMHFPHVAVAEQGQGPQHAIARARAMERHRPLIEHMHVL